MWPYMKYIAFGKRRGGSGPYLITHDQREDFMCLGLLPPPPTHPSINLPTYLPTFPSTYLPIYLHIKSPPRQ